MYLTVKNPVQEILESNCVEELRFIRSNSESDEIFTIEALGKLPRNVEYLYLKNVHTNEIIKYGYKYFIDDLLNRKISILSTDFGNSNIELSSYNYVLSNNKKYF